jgi:hypothetical protein
MCETSLGSGQPGKVFILANLESTQAVHNMKWNSEVRIVALVT